MPLMLIYNAPRSTDKLRINKQKERKSVRRTVFALPPFGIISLFAPSTSLQNILDLYDGSQRCY